jgi:fatty acid desaturase
MTEMSERLHNEQRSDAYEAARKRVERKRKLRADVVAYVVINLALIGIWALAGFGYFWPGWVLAGWGVALALDAWNALYLRPITDDDVEREMRRTG